MKSICQHIEEFLNCCGSGADPAASFAGESGVSDQREKACEALEADRLLLEELKGELSQTKLELETTLKVQHKHLKELDTLRLDMSIYCYHHSLCRCP